MTMNPLPPQAYTKETLLKAYSWLQNQTEHIKELATTPDILVSLYIKAKMNGNAALETPSIQNFKSELKNLAGMMGEFEGHIPSAHQQPPAIIYQTPVHSASAFAQPQQPAIQPPAANVGKVNVLEEQKPKHSPPHNLDEQSLAMIRQIQQDFNLSSDQETVRLLISIGYKKMKSLT